MRTVGAVMAAWSLLLMAGCGTPPGQEGAAPPADGADGGGEPGEGVPDTDAGGQDEGMREDDGRPDDGGPGDDAREPPDEQAMFDHAEVREPVEAADPYPATIERFEVRDQRTVRALWWGGVEPCHVLAGVEVDETDDEVRVRVLVGRDAAADDDVACIMIALPLAVDVVLERDLADRVLIDAGDPAEDRHPDVGR